MKKLITVAVATVAMVAIAAPASAHVTVNPNSATQGGYARLAFRVPTESDTLSTTKLEVYLPEDAPVKSVSTMPVPGWTITTQKKGDAVSLITWTADAGAAIKPGEFQEFPVSLGPLPKTDQMVFKALQTYSDATVVRWIDLPKNDGSTAEHPAPILKLVPAGTPSASANVTIPLADNKSSSSTGIAWAGLAAGVLALIVAGFALARTRRA